MADEEDFLTQMIPYQGNLYRFILSLTGNYRDAEDLQQQTMLTLWQKWEERDRDGETLAWAFAIAKNHVRNHARKAARRGEALALTDQVMDRIAQKQLQFADLGNSREDALSDCLQALPDSQRDLVESYYDGQEPAQQLAERAQKSLDAFYKSLQRIRSSLFDCVTKKLAAGDQS